MRTEAHGSELSRTGADCETNGSEPASTEPRERPPVAEANGEHVASVASEKAWLKDMERRNREDLRARKRRERALERRWHCVYFLYDAKDRLLYVGISANGPARLNGHETTQPWWRKVVRVELEHVKTRSAALARELEAIGTLNPIWNVSGKRPEPPEPVVIRACPECKRRGLGLSRCCFCGWEPNTERSV